MLKRGHLAIKTFCRLAFLFIIPQLVVLTSFTNLPKSRFHFGPNEPTTLSGYMPAYKMDPALVNDIISGLPLDKRLIFQFVINGSPTSDVKVIWYKASGMISHAEGRESSVLDIIPGSTAISFSPTEEYILANNYLFVKTFKEYVRGLGSEQYEYIEFRPEKDANKHIRFKIRAVFKTKNAKAAGYKVDDTNPEILTYVDEGIESQPSPPADTRSD